jgi:hypothetical protein
MPAVASSPIPAVLDQLVAAVDEHRVYGSDLCVAATCWVRCPVCQIRVTAVVCVTR